jgi:putative membrane protein
VSVASVASVVALAVYGAGVWLLRRRGGRWPARHALSFLGGTAVVAAALSEPVDALADRHLTAHMAEHLALCLAAAPLLVLGRPEGLALRIASPRSRRRLAGVLRGRVLAVVAAPAAEWLLFAGVQWATHLTSFYDYAERHAAAHAGEHAAYLVTALLFWRVALAVEPARHRLSPLGRVAFLMTAMPAGDLIGAWLMSSGTPRYASYAAGRSQAAALADQRLAGVLMIAGSVVLALAAFRAARRWFVEEERRQLVREGTGGPLA